MEELGIGRPSTYASTLQVLRDRDYVQMDKNRFHPLDKGRVVIAFLENFFARYVEYDFTAALEGQLDKVSAGELDWKQLLRDFWTDFRAAVDDIGELRITNVLDALNEALAPHIFPDKEDGTDPRLCPSCGEGKLSLRLGKFGAFLGCSNHPDCSFTRQMSPPGDDDVQGDRVIVVHPETGKDVELKNGRFGWYLQMQLDGEDKPKRSSIPKGWDAATLTEEQAIQLIDLPRTVGDHPDDGQPITANIGRYGPYVHHDKTYANIPNVEDVFEIGVNRAVAVIADKRANGGRRGGTATALKELGEHDGKPVRIMSGRYGPYVKYEKVNATLPKDTDPESVTLEQAMEWVEAKAAKGGKKKAPAKKKPAAKKTTAAKKTAAKKTTAKKPAAKKPAAKKTATKKPAASASGSE